MPCDADANDWAGWRRAESTQILLWLRSPRLTAERWRADVTAVHAPQVSARRARTRPWARRRRRPARPRGTRRRGRRAGAGGRPRRPGRPRARPATRSASRCPSPTATMSSTRSTWVAAWVTQRGPAPTAAQYASISSCAVGASRRSTTSTGSPSRSRASTTSAAAKRWPGGTDTWSTGTRASGTDATRSRSTTGPRTMPTASRPGPQAVEDVQRGEGVGPHGGVGMLGPEGADRLHHPALAAVAVADGERDRRSGARRGGSSSAAAASKRSMARSTSRASTSSRSPAAVSTTRRLVRSNSAHAELGLQLADALRQGRRREVQPGRGAAEVALLGDGHEVAQPAQVDPATPRSQRYRPRHDPCPSRSWTGRPARRATLARVKLLWFHLMPYPELPEDFNKQHRSVWVDIDPGLFDPDVMADSYERYIDQLVYAEECGFDGICVNEHHGNGYGLDAVAQPDRLGARPPARHGPPSPCSATRWRSTTRRSASPRRWPCSTCCRGAG